MENVEKLEAELREASKICGECFATTFADKSLMKTHTEMFERMFDLNRRLVTARQLASQQLLVKQYKLRVKPTTKTDSRRSAGNICFLTVNPDDKKISLSTFLQVVHAFHQLVFVEKAEWVYEQRSVDEKNAGKGFHLHSVFTRTRKPAVVRSEIMRTFMPFVGNENHIKIKFVDESQLSNIRSYMSGVKKPKAGQSKADKVIIDQLWRRNAGIRALYTS